MVAVAVTDAGLLDTVPNDYVTARRLITRTLGIAAIQRIHKQDPFRDWPAIIVQPAIFTILVVALTRLSFGPLWLACFVLQGFMLQILGYTTHDLFVHRRVAGRRFGYALGVLFQLPVFYRRTWYALYHLDHHEYMGTERDTEAYKQDLDTRWKRFLCLTVVGFALARGRKLKPSHAVAPEIGKGPLKMPTDPTILRRLRRERFIVRIVAAALVPLSILWWQPVILGFVLPLLIVVPVAGMVRLILEHGEVNPKSIFNCATFYRTGLVSRLLFFWDAGDCHIVHHIYPAIPFYRMGEALALIRPILLAQGARERRSLAALLYGFFIRNEPHRTLWSR